MAWADGLRTKGSQRGARAAGKSLHVLTQIKRRNYVKSFCGWAYRFYDLRENPVSKLLPIGSGAAAPENIVAVRRFADLRDLIGAWKGDDYWQAWVAVACLAGPAGLNRYG
jgi:hypothetical protein